MKKVVPSVLTKDPQDLERKIRILEKLTDVIQIDIMDGELVPNVSLGIDEIERVATGSRMEMHLMVKHPLEYIEPFVNIGAFRIIFHIEASDNVLEVIKKIRQLNAEPGIAINPPTSVEKIQPYLNLVDIVLVMGVNPGFQGQKFIPETLDKVRMIKNLRPEVVIEVDGGVNPETGPDLINAGVDILNVGSYLFKESTVEDNWATMQKIIGMDNINTIGIIGAGTMGAGIAQAFAEGGYGVIWYNRSKSGMERGVNLIRLNQNTLIKSGVLTKDHAVESLERLKPAFELDDLADADFISESIAEDIKAKQDIFSRIDRICRKDAVFTTNTSGLSITKIASVVSNKSRFTGMHWWNPPHIMPLVEVIKGDESSEVTCMIVIDICKKLGRKPVFVKKDIPGFIGNRMQMALQREVMNILDMGVAAPEDIDTVMKYGPGARWALYGPCEIADLAGLDVVNFVSSYLFKCLSNAQDVPKVLSDKISKGELGTKTGKGFYQYTKEQVEEIIESRDKRLLKIFALQAKK